MTTSDWIGIASVVATGITGVALVITSVLMWRVSKSQQKYIERRDRELYAPALTVVSRQVPKIGEVAIAKLTGSAICWEIGLQNAGEVPIVTRHFQVSCVCPESGQREKIPSFKLVNTDDDVMIEQQIQVVRGETVITVVMDDPASLQALKAVQFISNIRQLRVVVESQVPGHPALVSEPTVSTIFRLPVEWEPRALEQHEVFFS